MKHYTHIKDLSDLKTMIKDAILLKMDPFKNQDIGKNKTLMMLYFIVYVCFHLTKPIKRK